jgi:hypothetical protein
MKVMVNCGVFIVFRVAYYSLEVAFRGGHKVGVVEKKSPWQVVPAHNAVLSKRS